jgi:EpsI family protein
MKTRIFLLCLILLATSAFIARASRPEIVPAREPLSGFPIRIGDWEGTQDTEIDSSVMSVLGVDDYVNRVYYSPELCPYSPEFCSAGLYVGYYQSQREGGTMHSPLNCMPGNGWNPVKRGHIPIQSDGNSAIEINRMVVQRRMEKLVVLYWYQSHGRVIASEYWSKIYTVLDALHTNRTDAAMVRVICPVPDASTEAEVFAEKRAVEFTKALYPLLARFIPE